MLAQEFTIFNMPFQISRERENYVRIRNKFRQLADQLVIEFENTYHKENKNMDDVHHNVFDQGNNVLAIAIKEAVAILITNEIYEIDNKSFHNNYYVKKYCTWFDYFEHIDDKYLDIIEATAERDAYRTMRRQNRSRWEGGGFGLSGSLQGAATAGMMNMTSGAIHGVVNLGAKAISSIGDSIKKSNLFKDEATLNTFKKGIRENVENVSFALMDILSYNDVCDFDRISQRDREKVKSLLNNITQVNKNESKKLIIQMLELDPYNLEIYKYIIQQNIDLDFSIVPIAEYFSMNINLIIEELLLDYFNQAQKEEEEDAKLVQQNIMIMMSNYHMDTSEALTKINKILIDIDIHKRTFKDYLYDTREEKELAIKQDEELKRVCNNIERMERLPLIELLQSITERHYVGNVSEEYINKIDNKIQQIETEILNQMCKNLNKITEEECDILKEKILELNFSKELSERYQKKVDNRIDAIWQQQDNAGFDRIYLSTNILSQESINNSILQVKEKGRTESKENYIKALESINEKNIKRTKDYMLLKEKGWIKKFSKEFILLLICFFFVNVFSEFELGITECLVAIAFYYSIFSIIRTLRSKKIYNIITLEGHLIHPQIQENKESYTRTNEIIEDNISTKYALNRNLNQK